MVPDLQFASVVEGNPGFLTCRTHHCDLWKRAVSWQNHRPKNQDKKMEPLRPRWNEEGIPWI